MNLELAALVWSQGIDEPWYVLTGQVMKGATRRDDVTPYNPKAREMLGKLWERSDGRTG